MDDDATFVPHDGAQQIEGDIESHGYDFNSTQMDEDDGRFAHDYRLGEFKSEAGSDGDDYDDARGSQESNEDEIDEITVIN